MIVTYSRRRRIIRVTRTLDVIADTVVDVLPDWSLSMFFGGPEPIRGGGLHCITWVVESRELDVYLT